MFSGQYTYILCLMLAVCLSACTPYAVREAQAVVAETDSLWQNGRMYGIDEGDSATLAEAYETLSSFNSPLLSTFNSPLSTSYAHACYHYGRLLRKKDNPVEAMQAFISATHTRTRDYHILGRVYSNMGSICHLASEYDLSYDMYEKSANMFWKNGDTLNYYYALNDMAFELAEEGEKDEMLILLDTIEHNCSDNMVLNKTLMTKAKLYFQLQLYDSVIYTTNVLQLRRDCEPTGYGLKARSFWHMGQVDSALYYANYVLSLPIASGQDKYNMFYIVSNADSTISNEDVLALSAQRSDIETDILIPLHNRLAVAVQLLQQDLNNKPDFRWLYAIIGTLAALTSIIGVYVYKKHKKQELLTQKIDVLETTANAILEKKEELEDCYLKNHKSIKNEINSRCSMFQTNNSIMNNLAWKNYPRMCKIVDRRFYFLASKLSEEYSLNETEVRICVLTLLDCSYDRMAELLYRSPTSIGTLKKRLASKLGTSSRNLRQHLIDNVCII